MVGVPQRRAQKGGGHHIGMGQDRPFGDTGRSSGKLDQGRVIRTDRDSTPRVSEQLSIKAGK